MKTGEAIRKVLEIARSDNFYGVSWDIERVKGAYALPTSISQTIRYAKREAKWQMKS